jgi:hypothetical protein
LAKRPTRVHMNNTPAGSEVRMALCGWTAVEVTDDLTLVTCAVCKKRRQQATEERQEKRMPRGAALSGRDLLLFLQHAAAALLAPMAGPPPRLDPALWASSCRGGEHRRCGSCELCRWEREAEKWAHQEPWRKRHRVRRPLGMPTWPSLASALIALAEWEHHNRFGPSAMGPMLERLRRGAIGDGGGNRPDDPLLARAAEMVPVREALEVAYPIGRHEVLSQSQCIAALMARTQGVLDKVPPYGELAAELGIALGDLQALVRAGRRVVTIELAARDLIPMPRPTLGMAEAIESARVRYERAS